MCRCEISVGVLLFHNFDFVIIMIESLCQFDTQVSCKDDQVRKQTYHAYSRGKFQNSALSASK